MRQSWTDDRLDDLARRVDTGFAQVHEDIAALRVGQERLGSELRQEMTARFEGVDRKFEGIDRRFDTMQATMLGGFLTVIAAVIAGHFL